MHPRQRAAQRQRQRVLDSVGNTDACGFFDLLTGPRMLERIEALLPEHRERVFPPTETLSMFLAQALSADGSCRQAVDEAAVKRLLAGLPPHSTNTSAYCQARARLPKSLIATLARQTGAMIAAAAPSWWHWRGRPVRLVDGATVTLSDTAANQAAYPQPSGQKAGLGFPICRVVALLCLGSGALLDALSGPCEGKGSDEQSLLRELLDTLQEDDILLGDAFYATYFLLCELVRGGVDGLFEQYGARKRSTDFSQGERLGARDHLIVLSKPKRPEWMSQYEYDQVPATLTVREFHAGGKILVTTFLCPKETPKSVLKALYRCRWNIELDLRNIKTTLGMEHLRCKSPDMASKELWVYVLAYNLIRLLMAQAALLADQIPRQLSFKHTVQVWVAWQSRHGETQDAVCLHALLVLIAEPRVGLRRGRIEPRALKRRPKNYPLLTKPRRIAQEE
ncbi:IS4 family transposase, partial [Thiocystis violacea]|uniref:IS4 family transposase n=1 Tax=Thiocystis violacea TaxID=13725 RepID=UPI001906D0BF